MSVLRLFKMAANQSDPGLNKGMSSKWKPCEIYRRICDVFRLACFNQKIFQHGLATTSQS